MKPLKKREQLLAVALGGFLVLMVGRSLFSMWQGPLAMLRTQKANLSREIERKEKQIKKGQAAQARIDAWNRRSLPTDPDTARSLYQNWLLALAAESGFEGTKVEAGQGRQRGDVYHALRFGLQAHTTLDRVTRFLHRFYTAGHLHQIRTLSLVPLEKSDKLELQLAIEALVLPGADRKDKLTTEQASRLASPKPTDYQVIASRNLFAPYKAPPPQPVEPPPPPPFDPGKHAYLTGIVDVAGKPEAWLLVRTSGEKLKLHEGETFRVADMQGKIVRIGLREVEVELAGQRWRYQLGDNLREMIKVPSQ
jgi:hypothetical protein